VFKRHRGPELHAWRTAITAAAEKVCGSGWVAPNTALQLVVVFTVPAPQRVRSTEYPDGYRDLDKLIRAAADALSAKSGFRVVASDMRYVRQIVEKTYPTPWHTHPLALDQPGVWLRIQPPAPVTVDATTWSITVDLPTTDCVSERTTSEGVPA